MVALGDVNSTNVWASETHESLTFDPGTVQYLQRGLLPKRNDLLLKKSSYLTLRL